MCKERDFTRKVRSFVKTLTERLFWSSIEGNKLEIQISTFGVILPQNLFISYYIGINFLNFASSLPFVKDRSFAPT